MVQPYTPIVSALDSGLSNDLMAIFFVFLDCSWIGVLSIGVDQI